MKDPEKRKKWEKLPEKYKEYFKSNDELWYENYYKLIEFFEMNKKRPNNKSKTPEEKRLGEWLSDQISNYKNNQQAMKDPEKRKQWGELLENYKEYFISIDEIWYTTYLQVIEFLSKNNRKPTQTSKDPDEKILGNWFQTQTQNYKNNEHSMKDNEKRKKWDELLEKYKEYFKSDDEIWYDNYNEVVAFIELNKRRPSSKSKLSEEQYLGVWIQVQQREKFKNSERKYKWNEFIDKYKEYFKSDDEIWYDNYTEVVAFIEINKKRPSSTSKNLEEKSLGSWTLNQNRNYKNNKNSMKDLDKRQKFENLVKQYPDLFPNFEFIELPSTLPINTPPPQQSTSSHASLSYIPPQSPQSQSPSSTPSTTIDISTLSTKTVPQLKELCKEYKLKVSGKKDELITRIVNHLSSNSSVPPKENTNILTEDEIEEKYETPQPKKSILHPPSSSSSTSSSSSSSSTSTSNHNHKRIKSRISELHQKYKTLRSDNLHKLFSENTELWHEYHTISEQNESLFSEQDEIPYRRVIKYLEQIKSRRDIHIADLGCGKAKISDYFKENSKFKFYNYDQISIHENITKCDISKLPLEDNEIDISVLCLSMW